MLWQSRRENSNLLRDAIFSAAQSAALGPTMEERFLLPGSERKTADVLIPHWAGGKDATFDITVIHPLQSAESLGGCHRVTEAEVRKLGSALGRHTGQEEGEATSQLFQQLSILLMKGNSALFLNRTRFDQDGM